MALVQQLLQGRAAVPWPAIQQAVCEVAYGGHALRERDRGVLQALARRFLQEAPIPGLPSPLPSGDLASYRCGSMASAWSPVIPHPDT